MNDREMGLDEAVVIVLDDMVASFANRRMLAVTQMFLIWVAASAWVEAGGGDVAEAIASAFAGVALLLAGLFCVARAISVAGTVARISAGRENGGGGQ